MIEIKVNNKVIAKVPSFFQPMKNKIQFTDSNNRDFEFWIYDTIVRFYYGIEFTNRIHSNAKISVDLKISQIEEGVFPSSLNDFAEAKDYLKKYFENIAFV